jgi:signal transduction histidine kinase
MEYNFNRFNKENHKFDIITASKQVAEVFSSNEFSNCNNIEQFKEYFYMISPVLRLDAQLISPDGEVIAYSGLKMHFPPNMPPRKELGPIRLNGDGLTRLKNAETFTDVFRISDRMEVIFSVSPIFNNNRFIGSVMTFLPSKSPPFFMFHSQWQLLLTLIAALITAFFLSRYFVSPVYKMEEAARKLSSGDFSCKMNLKREDELGFLAKAFDDMSEKLKLHNENKSKMLSYISHELNTPLSCIQASTEALQDSIFKTEEERKKYFDLTLRQIKKLELLIDDVRELSKFETKENHLSKTHFCVSDLLKEALQTVEFLTVDNNITISTSAETQGLIAYGDPEKILHVLQNLVTNAIQHNNQDILINISAKEENDSIVFIVEDNGKGIPQEDIQHICERFYKVSKARTTGKSGMGLGLAIVKEILQAHGEELKIFSENSKTQFSFRLPVSGIV